MRPFQAKYTPKLARLSPSATKIFQEYTLVGEIELSYLKAGMANVHTAMMPGQALSVTSEAAIRNLANSVEKLQHSNSNIINFRSWIASEVMISKTNSVYGTKYPLLNPEIIQAYK